MCLARAPATRVDLERQNKRLGTAGLGCLPHSGDVVVLGASGLRRGPLQSAETDNWLQSRSPAGSSNKSATI
jgi:hypothetical protein